MLAITVEESNAASGKTKLSNFTTKVNFSTNIIQKHHSAQLQL